MRKKTLAILMAAVMVLAMAAPALASPPYPEAEADIDLKPGEEIRPFSARPFQSFGKSLDQPNMQDYLRIRERQQLLAAGRTAEADALAQTGTDRVLVILVEFAGKDTFVWQAPTVPYSYTTGSQWDPLGIADPDEYTGNVGDCNNILQKIADEQGLTITDTWGMTFTFTYEGPLHNQIMRPISTTDRSGDSIWTDDFDPQWFEDFMFGNGVVISYTMQSGEVIHESFIGQSVADYYNDLSSGTYTITGDVIGWLGLPHSTWAYDTDECPGARSGARTSRGMLGTSRDLVRDALDAVNAISNTIPGFDWANYDLDGNGIIDRLWIVHAGYGEEDSTTLLNRYPVTGTARTITYPAAFYGESAVWSHSSAVTPPYSVTKDIAAGPYIIMPENGGIGVFAHEYGHNLGAWDLYAYGYGETSAGFWALQADDWTGYPIGFEPPAPDAMHLDMWGWLDPLVVTDTSKTYEAYLGQASYFDTNTAPEQAYRGVKIVLPKGQIELPSPVWGGDYYWWGGKTDLANASMTTADPIDLTAATAATLTFDLAYDIEDEWDFLWVQVSEDGVTWPYSNTLTNANTQCVHDPSWIGYMYGFPDDLCAAGIGGFYGYNANFPDPETQVFDLSAFAGKSIYLRLWYMTDWATTYSGAFVDNVMVTTEDGTAFEDDAESGDAKWNYVAPWIRSDGIMTFDHYYYLQWRNVGANGGYDSALGDPRWRFGPANTGLLVWYNNTYYTDNEIYTYLDDPFSFGPKGNTLVIDSHPEPYRNPYQEGSWLGKENTNLTTRGLMRDAPFTLKDTVSFTYSFPYYEPGTYTPTLFSGRPAVSTFNDGLGYYPGVASEGDGTYWSTVDWDASAVVPAKKGYSVKSGAGYPGYHILYRGDGWYGFWHGVAGTGNPGDDGVQYGWVVELVEEGTDGTWGKVKIYNQQPYEYDWTPKEIDEAGPQLVTYTVTLNNAGVLTQTRWFTLTLDPNLAFVSASWAPQGTLVYPTYEWAGEVEPGKSLSFTLVASMTVSPGTLKLPGGMNITTTLAHNDFMNPVSMNYLVTHIEKTEFNIFLPLVMKNF